MLRNPKPRLPDRFDSSAETTMQLFESVEVFYKAGGNDAEHAGR